MNNMFKKKKKEDAYKAVNEASNAGLVEKPWGEYRDLIHTDKWHIKTIHIKEGEILSLQKHQKREELWIVLEGAIIAEIWWGDNKEEKILKVGERSTIPVKYKHRVSAYKGDAVIAEISFGEFDEKDIKRYSDKYGRK